MSLLRNLADGLRSLFRKEQVCQELDEEVDGFLEMAVEEKMKRGMSRKDALRAVRLERGSLEVAKEVVWSAHWESVVDTLGQDFRFALRTLRKSPGFAAAAILTLALGIGVNTAIFSLLNALIRPLNVPEPDRLVRVFSGPFGTSYEMSYPNYVDLRGSAQSFSELAVYSFPQPMSLAEVSHNREATSQRVWGIIVSGNYFKTLGVSAMLGRTFAPDEDRTADSRPVVVISHRLWRERFNGDPNIIGFTVKLNGYPFEVIGVAPDRMLQAGLLLSNDLWIPMMMEGEAMPGQSFKLTSRNETFLNVIGRLRPGVTFTQARAEAKTLADRMERDHPKENHQFGLSVLTEREGRTPFLPGLEQFGWILLAIVGLVLLIACANVAGLVLVRALGRRKELGIRMSIGATRSRLVQQLVTEGIILSSCGGLLGLGIAAVAIRTLLKFAPPLPLEISLAASLDHRVLMFTLGMSLATGILFSTLPAFRSTRLDVTRMLKAGDAILGEGRARVMGRYALVVAQIAVSLLLLIIGGLFVRSLGKAQQINLGFDPTNRLLASADTFLARYSDKQSRAFDARLLEEVRSMPGVIDVSSTAFAPLSGGYLGDGHVYIEGETPVPDYDRPKVFYDKVGASFFRTMGTPLLAGRDFTERDVNGSAQVAVVNQTFADSFWPGQNPIGKRLRLNSSDVAWVEVVGLVPTGKYLSLGEAPQRHLFLAGHSSGLIIHTASDPHLYMQVIRASVQRLDPNVAVASVETMNEHLGFAFYPARMCAFLLGLFSILGLSLAMLGLYGLLAFVVRQRTHEVGIRIALGARKHNVLSVVMRQGILLVALGMTLGLSAAYAASRVVAGFLYGIGGRDFFTFTEASFLLAFVALLAMYMPARRATQVDPMVALRYE
jgi:macrolide transport system ATP-binding/permease protein